MQQEILKTYSNLTCFMCKEEYSYQIFLNKNISCTTCHLGPEKMFYDIEFQNSNIMRYSPQIISNLKCRWCHTKNQYEMCILQDCKGCFNHPEKAFDLLFKEPISNYEPPKSRLNPLSDYEPKKSRLNPLSNFEPPKSRLNPLSDYEPKSRLNPLSDYEPPKSRLNQLSDYEPKSRLNPLSDYELPKSRLNPLSDYEQFLNYHESEHEIKRNFIPDITKYKKCEWIPQKDGSLICHFS